MLTVLEVRSLAVIDELRIPLPAGLTVVTGETGAGKSLLIDALALATGERADAGIVREGAEAAEIVAAFTIPADGSVALWLAEHGLDTGNGDCHIRRVVAADRSRAFVNGTPVPIQRLRELGESLIDLHGQHEHHSLMRRETQRLLLDAYAGATHDRLALTAAYAELDAVRAEQRRHDEDLASREARVSLLRYQLDELDDLSPVDGEWETLAANQRRLAHAAEVTSGLSVAADRLTGGDDALASAVETIVTQLRLLERYEPRIAEASALLTSAALEITEAGQALSRLGDNQETEPAALLHVEERLGRWHDLARKHRVPPEQLPALYARLKTEQATLTDRETGAAERLKRLSFLENQTQQQAVALSARRRAGGQALAGAVTAEIQRLGLATGRFEVALNATPLTAQGCEDVEFLVSAQPDSLFRPLAKAASGGELSRISLAIQVVLAAVYGGPTLVFDEVDVGIGGAVAEIVGQRLHELAGTRQILCITHLPQVAAQGDTHLRVRKDQVGGRTVSSVETLSAAERIEEIARMLGGIAITARTRALAKDMLRG
ncbi:MAG: DNA repair protein RecN [Acidiferrobacter sp.]